ncbi:cobalamin biosynthesis protein [Rhizobium sp. TH2]|uniref:adenosylcobinamide-phosphate synthase CbiB n=1 Tax=Rhizobium sp. TH2 TaxID=2775403 RepID=UPI00215822D6|nr:adenosylcobinamide-phosphate synthase CbiB [Rhizobium sp. TH2]UVC11558.1 cobalamin biosynthesis protein [Rhizobium sp. TH2]
MYTLYVLFLALLVDRAVGDPESAWSRIPHPVVLFGRAVGFCERQFNHRGLSERDRRAYGIMAILALLIASVMAGVLMSRLFVYASFFGVVAEIIVVAVLLAQKSLVDHVGAVAQALRKEGIVGGRRAVSMVVGRDPNTLDRAGVCRAAIETLAENFSDGVVAPALFYAVFGLPGLFAYKMLNTADSMIGHMTPRYRQFGWASAKLDDIANWPAARLSAVLIALGTWFRRGKPSARQSISVALRDHGLHRSPNSGWPESAMAGSLDIALAGPRTYAGEEVMEPMQNSAGRKNIGPTDIDSAIEVFWAACSIFTVLVPMTALFFILVL